MTDFTILILDFHFTDLVDVFLCVVCVISWKWHLHLNPKLHHLIRSSLYYSFRLLTALSWFWTLFIWYERLLFRHFLTTTDKKPISILGPPTPIPFLVETYLEAVSLEAVERGYLIKYVEVIIAFLIVIYIILSNRVISNDSQICAIRWMASILKMLLHFQLFFLFIKN